MALPSLNRQGSRFRPVQFLKKLLPYWCGFFLLAYFIFFAYRLLVALTYPYPLDYTEGHLFEEARRLFHADFNPDRLYPANTDSPFLYANFGPLFYYLNAGLMLLTGDRSLLAGRLVGGLAGVYLLWQLYRVCRREELAAGRRAGLLIGLATVFTLVATPVFYRWGVLARPDTLGLVLALAAVERVWRANAESERRRSARVQPYLIAGLLCSLALLTRPGLLAAPLAIAIWLGLQLRWRDLGAFAVTLGGVFGLAVALFQVLTGGHFLTHFLTYNAGPFDGGIWLDNLGLLAVGHLVLFALALVWVARPLVGRFERLDVWRVYFMTALLGLGLSGFSLDGSVFLLESLWLVVLLAWWQLGRLLALRPVWRLGSLRPEIGPLVLLGLALQLSWLLHVPVLNDPTQTAELARTVPAEKLLGNLREVAAQGPILAEDCAWLALLNLPVELDAPAEFAGQVRAGAWNEQLLLDRLNRGYYKLVLFELIPPGQPETQFDQALQADKFLVTPKYFSPQVRAILQDPARFAPYKRVDRWLLLKSKA